MRRKFGSELTTIKGANPIKLNNSLIALNEQAQSKDGEITNIGKTRTSNQVPSSSSGINLNIQPIIDALRETPEANSPITSE